MEEKCNGCGALIQFTNEELKGYIEKDVYDKRKSSGKEILCKRCFKLKNYNEVLKQELDEDKFITIVKDNVEDNMLVCYVIDAFDLDGTFIKNINDIFPNNKILVIANKYDLFMRSNRPTKIKKYISSYLEENNIKVTGISVTTIKDEYSPSKIYNTIKTMIESLSLSNQVFMFGNTNVGKSSIINMLIKEFKPNDTLLTVSNSVSTTLNINKIVIGDFIFFDTPGLVNKKQVTYYLNKKTIDHVMAKSFIKPVIFQLNTNQTIFIEGFANISIIDSTEKVSMITYFSKNIVLHRTKYENKDNFYKEHINDILIYPKKEERKKLGPLKKVIYEVSSNEEISFSGLGFIGFNNDCKVEIETFDNILVTKRKKMI